MDATRFRRIREVFDRVQDLDGDVRERALIDACGDDTGLLADVRELLAQVDRGTVDVDETIGNLVAGAASTLDIEHVEGQRVGPYRIVREIGQGGMGAVYLAERVDGQFEQRVALKRIRPGFGGGHFLPRFRAERQIVARLQHPNIARLLDGGVDDDGRPYFALEYVEGEPIDRYCDRCGLSVDERLELFLQACDAVTYAHANLVVHRDLKPAHILVTPDGEARLLDFGIAKVLTEEPDEAGELTELGIRAMTPEYASPEQVRGEGVGTATDVYALGVILYELLTGARPYTFDSRTPADVERVVCGTEPSRPSTRVVERPATGPAGAAPPAGLDAARVRKRLRGDLDVICLKALQKDPARRYASVEALRDDIRRNLDGRPVLARPDSASYRLGRFVARHRLGVGVAAAVLVAFLSVIAYHTSQLAAERDLARQEAEKAAQVAAFLQDLFAVSDPSQSRGESVTARELLDAGAQRIERELAGQPEVLAAMLRVIGDTYHALGLFEDARAPLERSLAERRALFGDEHLDTAESKLALASLVQDQAEYEEAERLFREGHDTRRRLLGEPHPLVAESLAGIAFLQETRGDADAAEATAREVLAMQAALHPRGSLEVAEARARLGGFLRRQQRYEEAEPLLRAALDAQRQALGSEDLTVASTARNLASLLRDLDKLDEAEALYREVIDIRMKMLGERHPEVGVARNSYALLLARRGDVEGAAAEFERFIDVLESMHAGRAHADLAAALNNLASIQHEIGDVDAAIESYRRSLRMVDEVLDPGHPNTAFARLGLATVYIDEERFAEAEPLVREALAIRRAALPEGHRYIGDALVELGTLLTGRRRFADAEDALLDAYAIYRDDLGPDDSRTSRARERLERLYAAWGTPERVDRIDEAAAARGGR